MKILVLLLAIGMLACSSHKSNKIVKNECKFNRLSKSIYIHDDVFFSYVIELNDDSTFEYTFVSERDNVINLSVGRWLIDKDSLILESLPQSNLNLMCVESDLSLGAKDTCVLTFFDKEGIPISNFKVQPVNEGEVYHYRHVFDISAVFDEKQNVIEDFMFSDKNGNIIISEKTCDSVDLVPLTFIKEKSIRLATRDLSRHNMIRLSLNRNNFINGQGIIYKEKILFKRLWYSHKKLVVGNFEFIRE